MDFYRVCSKTKPNSIRDVEIFPDFSVERSKDLMVRARSFYAIWDEERGVWSTDEYDVARLVDAELNEEARQSKEKGFEPTVKHMSSFNTNSWSKFKAFMATVSDNSHQLDETLTFANDKVKRSDYVSRRLPYALEAGDHSAWDELVGTLYSVDERAKLEWAIGSVVAGDSKKLQKFFVLYGPAGTGKSTVLNIIDKLFEGYTTSFEAKALGSSNNTFATEAFKNNPLVAIQHDGDLSKIEDNTKLNSIVSHEAMTMNEKYKPSYTSQINALLFVGTNQPVKISDAKSGLIRRLIDVHPTGVKVPANHYHALMSRIDFELGAIAQHCLEVYRDMGKNYYNTYRPLEMMFQTDVFFNFIEANYDVFKSQDGVTLQQAYALYKEYCADTGISRILPQYKLREELRNYFDEFKDRAEVDGVRLRSYYQGFNATPFKTQAKDDHVFSLVMDETVSILDELYAEYPAQLANADGNPSQSWRRVKTTLADVDTSQLHWVKVPDQHIVIDFDLKTINGDKSLERNLEAASLWPPTYAELSKSEAGVHLHYHYEGDPQQLNSLYSEGIEIKTYPGDASLRRRLSKCNNVPIAILNGGLPLKEKKMLKETTIQSEKGLRDLIRRNLRKEIHPGTKPSVDFISKILDDAYKSGLPYDVTDLRPTIVAFANNSSNWALPCLKVVQKMKFVGQMEAETPSGSDDDRLVFFDVEVYPNLFVICWKYQGSSEVVRMINPSPQDVESLFKYKLIGFNNRRYDNHILYARFMGYDNETLYKVSQKMIENLPGATFGEAYNLSYADIYDFSTKKESLKRFEIDLGIHHMELDLPWDKPVDPKDWERVVKYCENDVRATEAVFESRKGDFTARQILAHLSGLTVNDTTQKHTSRIIFGKDKSPQQDFVYTNLSEKFPGYEFDMGKSTYRGETVGEGGYVYAEPGMYENVALLDVASMHPASIELLNAFGPYTKNFSEIKAARIAIKHKNYVQARKMFGGRLEPYLRDESDAEALSYALKIAINIVYGLTSAKFDNPFRDPRNKDNIVAKRGALFMIDLKHAVQEQGYTVAHIKTDSIKIPNADPEIIKFVTEFGAKYGYVFEHEATYEKFCLVNDAVYVASKADEWVAVGAQFQHPYVFKTLFSGEPIVFEDMCETKQVFQGSMYLDMEHDRPIALAEGMQHIGRSGLFVPVTEASGGGVLYRVKEDKNYAVTGTKGHMWLEAEVALDRLDKIEIDMSYFANLVDNAIKTIAKFGDVNDFVGEQL